jgi:hypothetical protein
MWMNKNSISYHAISAGDPIVFPVLAHLFAVVVTRDLVFPAVDLSQIVPIRLDAIVGIKTMMRKRVGVFCGQCRLVHSHKDFMGYPLDVVCIY